MTRRLPLAVLAVAALLAAGCGSDDDDDAGTPTVPAELANCSTNASGVIRSIDQQANEGFIEAETLGDKVRFDPRTDFFRDRALKQGDDVFFTYEKDDAGGTATCIMLQGGDGSDSGSDDGAESPGTSTQPDPGESE